MFSKKYNESLAAYEAARGRYMDAAHANKSQGVLRDLHAAKTAAWRSHRDSVSAADKAAEDEACSNEIAEREASMSDADRYAEYMNMTQMCGE